MIILIKLSFTIIHLTMTFIIIPRQMILSNLLVMN